MAQPSARPRLCQRPSCGLPRYGQGIYCRACRRFIITDTECRFPAGNIHHVWYLRERHRRMKLRFHFDGDYVIREDENA